MSHPKKKNRGENKMQMQEQFLVYGLAIQFLHEGLQTICMSI